MRISPMRPAGVEGSNGEYSRQFHLRGFLIEPQTNRIVRGAEIIQVEPKIMRVLVFLAGRCGEVVTREQLLVTVWSDTVVGEEALTRSISELRRIFDDDAKEPRFIETIRKVGYRLIAPVAFEENGRALQSHPPANHSTPMIAPASTPARKINALWLALPVAAVVIIGFAFFRSRPTPAPAQIKTTPLTSFPGREIDPALSPDGDQVAFAWNKGAGSDFDIYIKRINAETPLQLTGTADRDSSPAWSPDGKRIAFTRADENGCRIMITPATGGPESELTRCMDTDSRSIAWSPDGESLAFTDKDSTDQSPGIFIISLETLERRRVTSPPVGYVGDNSPVFSPDSRRLAFNRTVIMGIQDIFTVSIEGGEPMRLTFDNLKVAGLDWSAESDSIIFSSNRGGSYSLWKIPSSGGAPAWIPTIEDSINRLSGSRRNQRLVYEQWEVDTNIWQMNLSNGEAASSLIASTRWDASPDFSPDGRQIAFASKRSGSSEIWKCDGEGMKAVQLTSMGGAFTNSPRFSPDGKRIAFESCANGNADIYVINAVGGAPQRVTSDPSSETAPRWSADGRWIYYASNRTGRWEVWKSALDGDAPVQVTRQGGYAAVESFDGRSLFYTKQESAGIWQCSLDGEGERLVISDLRQGDWERWAVSERGIYFAATAGQSVTAINFFDFSVRLITQVATIQGRSLLSLTVSSDGRRILFPRVDRSESDIFLAEHFPVD